MPADDPIHAFDPARVAAVRADETALFADRNPASRRLASAAGHHMPGGVPMHWMKDWSTPFPLAVASARGATLVDVDGHELADFCLGDTGAMFGHAPSPVVESLRASLADGFTTMTSSPDAAAVGEALARLFGLPFWQVTQTASDANRAVIRWSRAITGRRRLVVFEGCYHGQVDDVFVTRDPDGRTVNRPGLLGEVRRIGDHTTCLPFNDLAALEAELASGDVALVLTEPALTNTAMVLPAPGYLDALLAACRSAGTLVCLDETHTLSAAHGGYARSAGLEPDFLVVGKPIAGGLPAAVFGFTAPVAAAMADVDARRPAGYSGVGTTLSGNRLQLAAIRATLEAVMTEEAYAHMLALAERLADGLADAIRAREIPWSVTRLGARAEIVHVPEPLKDGAAAAASVDHDLEAAIHLRLLNRGFLVTPFHNMTLVSPATTAGQVDGLVSTFAETLDALAG